MFIFLTEWTDVDLDLIILGVSLKIVGVDKGCTDPSRVAGMVVALFGASRGVVNTFGQLQS